MNFLQPLYSMKSSRTQENAYETFYHKHDMHNTTQSWYTTQKCEANMKKTCKTSIILSKTHNSRTLRQQMWNTLTKTQNPYLFLKIGEEVRKNMESLCVNTMILKEGKTDKKMNSHEMGGKNEKFLKPFLKNTLTAQSTQFSRLKWVANKSPKTLMTKFGKTFV